MAPHQRRAADTASSLPDDAFAPATLEQLQQDFGLAGLNAVINGDGALHSSCPRCEEPLVLRPGQNGAGPEVTCAGGCTPSEIADMLYRRQGFPADQEPHDFAAELRWLRGEREGATRPRSSRAGSGEREREVVVTQASEIAPRPVRWLWEHRLPLGKLAVIGGRQGQGKSLLTIALAAMVSTGTCPGDLEGQPGNVLLISGEDDPEDTIIPRLIAAGADLNRVGIVDVRERDEYGEPIKGPISLPGDVPKLRRAARDHRAQAVIIDPVVAFLDREHSAINTQDTRRALAPLKALAEEEDCSVGCVMHLNKASGTDALMRIAESPAFTALARSVLLFGPDPEDPDGDRGAGKALVVAKANLAGHGAHGLSLRIETQTIRDDAGDVIPTARLTITGASGPGADDLLSDPDDRSALRDACAFLRSELAGGPLPAKDVKAAAEEAGVAERTLRRARQQIGVKSVKQRVSRGIWTWELPAENEGGRAVPVPETRPPWPPSSKEGQGGQRRDAGEGRPSSPSGPSRRPRPPLPPRSEWDVIDYTRAER